MRLSLVIPSYKRPSDLKRCLEGLRSQIFRDFEVLCVCRPEDSPTREVVAGFRPSGFRVAEVLVAAPGLVAAMNAGFVAADPDSEFVAFTDDDTQAPPEWLSVIVGHFEKYPGCGAVGGPDRLQLDIEELRNPPLVDIVGRYTWSGGFHATHHCPIRPEFVRSDVLKGVNMTFRHALIRGTLIGQGIIGRGAQVGSEQSLASRVVAQGGEIHFVRDAWLLHYASPRTKEDERLDMTTPFSRETTRNQAFIYSRYLPPSIAALGILRQLLVGSRFVPGILRLPLKPHLWRISLRHLPCVVAGALRGIQYRLFSRP